MKRTIISLILSLCLCFGVGAEAFGSNGTNLQRNISDADYMKMIIEENSNVEITPTDSYYILDTSGNLSYVCIEFDVSTGTDGFGIIDLSTYDVTMYALDAEIPFTKDDTVIYNGLLEFAVADENNNTATILNSNVSVPINLLYDDSREGIILTDENTKLEKTRSKAETRAVEPADPILVPGGDDTSLVYKAGYNSGTWPTDCGINVVAMYLRHMDNYSNIDHVPNTHNTEVKLKVALAEIADAELGETTSISMNSLASLTNKYMETYSGIGTTSVSRYSYSWTSYKNRINNGNGKPCILYIGAGETEYWTGAHAVLGVGYTGGTTSSSGFLVVNSGWTSLNYVQIEKTVPGSMIR